MFNKFLFLRYGSRSAVSYRFCSSGAKRKNPVIPALSEHSKTTASASGPQIAPTAVRQKNALVAAALFGFVGWVYWYSISKMRNKDELSELIDREQK